MENKDIIKNLIETNKNLTKTNEELIERIIELENFWLLALINEDTKTLKEIKEILREEI